MSTGKVFLLVNAVLVCLTSSNAMFKDLQANQNVSAFEISFIQSFINILLASLLVKFVYKENATIPEHMKYQVYFRNTAQTMGYLFLVSAQKFLPLGIFFVIFSSNIFTTAILAFCWLSEVLSKFEIIAMLFAFTGIVMIGMSQKNAGEEIKETPGLNNF